MKILFVVVNLFFTLFFIGCAKAYYKTESDPQATFNKNEPLTIKLGNNPSVENKKFAFLLRNLMIEEGFAVLDLNTQEKESQCYITFKLRKKTERSTGQYTDYQTITRYHGGVRYGNQYIPPSTTTITIPKTRFYTQYDAYQDVTLNVLCAYNNQKASPIWTGIVHVPIAEYDRYEENVLKNLIQLMGKEFKGTLNIDGHKNKVLEMQ